MNCWTLTEHGIDGLDDAMSIMIDAFDPRFGEAWTAGQCSAILSMPGAVLVIAHNPLPAGFALVRSLAGESELMLLAVVPSARRQGIGLALLQHSIALAHSSGSSAYFLEVRADNPALALYSAAGLDQVGIRYNYYRGKDGKTRDALTLRRSLR